MPTQTAAFYRHVSKQKNKIHQEKMAKLIEKYGGIEHTKVPREIFETQHNEVIIQSKYIEDKRENNHTEVYGSFWHKSKGWGYKCCLSTERDSECGGKIAFEENKDLVQKNREVQILGHKRERDFTGEKIRKAMDRVKANKRLEKVE